MTLIAGTRLGPYEIVSPLGAGGMGEDRGEYIAPFARLTINVGVGDESEIRRLLQACVADRTPPLSIAATCGPFLEAYRTDPEINRLIDTIFDVPPDSRA